MKEHLYGMVTRSPGVAIVLLGVVGALLWFGVYYPTGDDMGLIPFLYRWDDPELFTNDIAFGGSSQRFMFGLFVLHGLSRIMPLEFTIGLWIVCSHVFLLLGLWLIFKVLAEEVEAKSGVLILFSLLMICGRDAIIGYHLQSYGWAPHYLAHPLVFIALFCLVTRRFWAMSLLLVAACFVHALIGLQGTILCTGVILVNCITQLPKKLRIAVIIGICLSVVSVCLAVRSLDYSYVRISAFVRAPWHMIPQFDPAAIKKFVVVAIGFVVMGVALCRSQNGSRSIIVAGLIAIAGTLFGIWNNTTFAIPVLVLANPLELGPALHGLFLCMAALLIVRLARTNMPYLNMLPLLAPHKLGFYYFMLVLAVYQLVIDRLPTKSWMFQVWLAICALIFAVGGAWLLFPDGLVPWRSGSHYAYAVAVGGFVMALLHWAQHRQLLSLAMIAPAYIILFYLAYALTGGEPFWRIDLAQQAAEPALIDIAQFLEKNSAKESLVVHPPSIPNFQYLSHRSSFVSFKTVPLASNLLPEWLHRLQELGVYSKKMDYRTLAEPVIQHFENYYKLSGAEFVNLAARYPNISHIVLDKMHGDFQFLKPVYQNAHFAICEPILQGHRVLAENAFPITLPSYPILCEEFGKPHYDWVNRGFRGTIWLKRADDVIATLQLIAGIPNQKGEHTLLLSPKAESEKGFPVVSGAQVVTFACDMRFTRKKNSGGDVQLRLDIFSSQDGWSYHPREINVGEEWSHFEVSVSLSSNAVSVYPTMRWDPASEGCVLELRSPAMRWFAYDAPDMSSKDVTSSVHRGSATKRIIRVAN